MLKFYLKYKKEKLWFELDSREEEPVFWESIWDINKRTMRQQAELRAEAEALAKEAAIQESLTDRQRDRLIELDKLPVGSKKEQVTSYIVDTDLDPLPFNHKFNVITGTSNIFF